MIKKEITLDAAKEEVWKIISGDEYLSALWNSRIERGGKDREIVTLIDKDETVKIIKIEPHGLIAFKGGYGSLPLITTLELMARKNRSTLRVSVDGWENIDQNELRLSIPTISLEWERRMTLTKKMIESAGSAVMYT